MEVILVENLAFSVAPCLQHFAGMFINLISTCVIRDVNDPNRMLLRIM